MANTKKEKTQKSNAKAVVSKPKATEKSAKNTVKKDVKGNKTLMGTVVSSKMTNTVVVAIERKVAHKLYGKLIKVTKRIKADTNGMEIKDGDRVAIEQTRPLSKDKNFKVIRKEENK